MMARRRSRKSCWSFGAAKTACSGCSSPRSKRPKPSSFWSKPAEIYRKGIPEIPKDEPGLETKAAGFRAFVRYACKMATGSGKTTVMGMLAAWSILNRVAAPADDRFSDTILIVCPNVTIRERLQELGPGARGFEPVSNPPACPATPDGGVAARRGDDRQLAPPGEEGNQHRQRRLREGRKDRRASRGRQECRQGQ